MQRLYERQFVNTVMATTKAQGLLHSVPDYELATEGDLRTNCIEESIPDHPFYIPITNIFKRKTTMSTIQLDIGQKS